MTEIEEAAIAYAKCAPSKAGFRLHLALVEAIKMTESASKKRHRALMEGHKSKRGDTNPYKLWTPEYEGWQEGHQGVVDLANEQS